MAKLFVNGLGMCSGDGRAVHNAAEEHVCVVVLVGSVESLGLSAIKLRHAADDRLGIYVINDWELNECLAVDHSLLLLLGGRQQAALQLAGHRHIAC